MIVERGQTLSVGRHRVIGEVTSHYLAQPLSLLGDRFVHSLPKFNLESFQLRAHPIPACLSPELKVASMGSPADVPEAQKVERLRFTQPSSGSISGREATKLDQTGFLRMQRQRELFNRSRRSAWKRRASPSYSKAATMSSAKRT
jgi:hypothetical protein